MLLAVDLDEDLVDVEGIAVPPVFSFQSSSVYGSKFNAPEPDALVADCDSTFGQKVFDIPVAEIESIVEPNYVGNDIWWEAVTLVSIHRPIIRNPQLS